MRTTPLVARGRLAALVVTAGLAFAPLTLAQTQLPPPSYGQADARQDRIEELEAQLRQSTADNEDLQHQLMEARREIARLQGIVGNLSAANQSIVENAQTPPANQAQQPQQQAPAPNAPAKPDPGLNAAQQAHVGTLGTMAANAAPPAQAAPADPGAAYSNARQLLVQGNYPEAEQAFDDFLHAYPQADQAADARYWFAFTLLARNNYQDAASNFVTYLQRWPNGPRAPDAQVRLGVALGGLGQTRQACAAFAALPRSYPHASRAVRDMAQREAASLHCAA
ncbi:MAG TPA: tol-pal system protein YbgF [Caulobacterales bacterium]|nr:tol-pal system protein YbgF [Caulobacterales bacterium]